MSEAGHKPRQNFGLLGYNTQRGLGFGEGWAKKLLREKFSTVPTLYRKDLKGHFGCVNAIEFSNLGGEVIASGGDDRRVLIWNTEEGIHGRAKPTGMKGEHHSNIFCLAFDNTNTKIFSGGNDEQVIVHDLHTGTTMDVFNHEDAVYGISVDPLNDNVFASACDDGRILIYDIRAPPSEDPFCLANYMAQMHAVVYNPVEPRLLATANSTQGIGLWDVRKPRSCLLRYGGSLQEQSCMSVRINQQGSRIIALRRRLPPVMYDIDSSLPVYQFDHAGYYNSCTMKSCCFAGDDDQYLISGSDDFNLYVWRIPEERTDVPWVGEAHLVLRGHRSIVNQVRFNPANHLVISSGVEKIIKIWSPYEMPNSTIAPFAPNSIHSDPLTTVAEAAAVEATLEERPVYTQEEYYNLLLRSGQVMSHDYSHQSLDEDPRMMAFFDALVQRELEGFSSDDDSLESSPRMTLQFVVPGSDSEASVSVGYDRSLSDEDSPSPTPQPSAVEETLTAVNANNGGDLVENGTENDIGNLASISGQVPEFPQEATIGNTNTESEDRQGRSGTSMRGQPLDLVNMEEQASTSRAGSTTDTSPQGSQSASSTSVLVSTHTLPGQRLLSTRPRISELITLKRKEYLNNARKVDKLIRRKRRKTQIQQAEAESASSSTASTSTTTFSSSSSSSDTENAENSNAHSKNALKRRRRKARKKKRQRLSSSSNNDTSEEQSQGMAASAVAELRNKMTANKRAGFVRLKAIRTNSLLNNNNNANTDTNSDDNVTRNNGITYTTSNTNSSHVQNSHGNPANGNSRMTTDIGLTIKSFDSLLQNPSGSDTTLNDSVNGNGALLPTPHHLSLSTTNGATTSTCTSSSPFLTSHNSDSNNVENGEHLLQSSSGLSLKIRDCINIGSASQSATNENEDHSTNLEEPTNSSNTTNPSVTGNSCFKFKRLEKSTRRYRRRSQDSSGDEVL